MGALSSLVSYFSGGNTRNVGVQNSGPAAYSDSAAAPVSETTALQLSVVWACTRIITESLSSLPIKFYDVSTDGTRTVNTTHPMAKLFSGKVNRWQTKQEYLESIIYQLVLQGNNYSAIERGVNKDIVALVPLMASQMTVELQRGGARIYKYKDSKGTRIYSDDQIWHNKLFGNGIIGLSPLAHGRNSIGIAQAAEGATTKIYSNGAKPSGILTSEHVLKPEQRKQIKEKFAELSEGGNDRLYVLEADMKYHQVSLSPQDIELLSSRRYQVEDICRFFGVPSILVNDTKANTSWGSGIQQIIEGFYKFNLRPYMERIEASMMCNLLSAKDRVNMDIEFDYNVLIQPSMSDRIKTGGEAVQKGIRTPNEIRQSEGWKKLDGGDKLLVQKQMQPIENAGEK